jgi:hypothetical protein
MKDFLNDEVGYSYTKIRVTGFPVSAPSRFIFSNSLLLESFSSSSFKYATKLHTYTSANFRAG